jgi:type I restriction enzyme, S subunit
MTENTNCQDIAPQRLNDSRIEKLIAELCPEGVEFKELGEVAKYSKQRVAATVLNDENYVGVDNLLPNKQGKTKSSYVPTTGNMTRFESGDVLLGNIRPYLKKIWLASHDGGTNGDVLAIQINNKKMLQSEFLYYLLSSDDFFRFDMQFAKGAKMPRGNKDAIMKYIVPIPPLAIQQEIVKILDTFTTLEAELEAELEARKQQYGYYRDELLTFGDDVEWKTLGETCEIKTGQAPNAEISSTEAKYPYINAGLEPSGYLIEKNTSAETVTIPSRGQGGAGHVGYQNSDFWCGPLCYRIQSKERDFMTKFIYYYLRAIQKIIVGLRQTGSIPAVNRKELILIKIPLIAITEQERIVAILDKFDALVNDISVGLPAELNARRKLYEYYRNKLLTFKPLEEAHAKQ